MNKRLKMLWLATTIGIVVFCYTVVPVFHLYTFTHRYASLETLYSSKYSLNDVYVYREENFIVPDVVVYRDSREEKYLVTGYGVAHEIVKYAGENGSKVHYLTPNTYLDSRGVLCAVIGLFLMSAGYYSTVKKRVVVQRVVHKATTTPVVNSASVPSVKVSESISMSEFKLSDIAGYDSTKSSLKFVADCITDRTLLENSGATIPKGFIFYGPPGTGKTMMANAVAGEAGVPFFSVNASSFINKYVGTGAEAVRELYGKARANAPCIVFIDEIDAVGGQRGGDENPEFRNTINALLSELDGSTQNSGIITIAATNCLDRLDDALIRPGRFDRKVAIPLPCAKDRVEIFKFYAKNKAFDSDVDLGVVSEFGEGWSGATIKSLLNEAAIISVSRGGSSISKDDLDKAVFQSCTNSERGSVDDTWGDMVAWHEAGHAICLRVLANHSTPQVTIKGSSNGALGTTVTSGSKMVETKRSMEFYIMSVYAGRAAEEIFFGNPDEITSSASGDIKVATGLIKRYLSDYGMGNSLISLSELTGNSNGSYIVSEANDLAQKLYSATVKFLMDNRCLLENVANELISKETLTEIEIDAIIAKHNVV